MKQILMVICISLCIFGQAKSEVETHTFQFSESDYSIKTVSGDSLSVTSVSIPASYPTVDNPEIPIIGKSVALTNGETVRDFSVTVSKRLIRSGVDLRNAQNPIPTSFTPDQIVQSGSGYAAKIYPDSNCELSMCYEFGGVNIASFLISPFVFDAGARNLYFVDSIRVDMDVESKGLRKAPSRIRPDQIEIVQSIIDNPEIYETMPMMLDETPSGETYEYLIITNEALKPAFQPLADWKRKKGVRSKIITVEEIDQSYIGETQQIRIKTCLKDYYENHFSMFVLLGGDVNVVPAQMCYVNSFEKIRDFMPADVYYSCMVGNVNWDTNGDGKPGEYGFDAVNVNPHLYVSRAPVRTLSETKIFVDRTIEYEQSPKYAKNFLQTGTKLDPRIPGETFADLLFDEVINGKIIMGSDKFFDTYTFTGEDFTSQSFLNTLKSGYTNIEVICHGGNTLWSNGSKVFFDTNAAASMNNKWHSLITTVACHTNAFDDDTSGKEDPCLSEALIRNKNSGVIGYIGSSREGWTLAGTLDYSMAYETDFYYRLLDPSSKPENKHFGALVNFIKHTMLAQTNTPIYRWLHFAINAMGDPEMPLFNAYPKMFDSATAEYGLDGILVVKTGSDKARVCVSSVTGEDYYAIGDGNEVTFNTGEGDFDIWITQQNYIPKHIEISKPDIEKANSRSISETKIMSVSPNPATDQVDVEFTRSNPNSRLELSLTNISTSQSRNIDVSKSGTCATVDVSTLQSGVYIVNLIENGVVIPGSERLIKQ